MIAELIAIRDALGSAPAEIKPEGWTRFSTSNRPGNRDGWARVLANGDIIFGCWRQHINGLWSSHSAGYRAPLGDEQADFKVLANLERDRLRVERINSAIFDGAHSLRRQSPIGQYLVNRGLGALSKCPQALRMATLPYFEDRQKVGQFSVMLAAVTDHSGSLIALHRTYIDENGTKAHVSQPKKLSRASAPLAGASIKLFAPTVIAGKMVLGVAEGVETALACHLASGIPVWSCATAYGIRFFEWPDGLQSLVIFSDNDANGVGQAAARDLAGRAAGAGIEVRVLVPEVTGTDWLDVYLAEGDAT